MDKQYDMATTICNHYERVRGPQERLDSDSRSAKVAVRSLLQVLQAVYFRVRSAGEQNTERSITPINQSQASPFGCNQRDSLPSPIYSSALSTMKIGELFLLIRAALRNASTKLRKFHP
jgi:hypothetical protein